MSPRALGVDFYLPQFNATRTYPYTVSSAAAGGAGTTEDIRIPGVDMAGLVGMRIDSLSSDVGSRTGAAIDTVQVKLIPSRQPGLFGGSIFFPFSAFDTFGRRSMQFTNAILYPGESILATVQVGTAARAVDLVFWRTLLFWFDPTPAAR